MGWVLLALIAIPNRFLAWGVILLLFFAFWVQGASKGGRRW